jgi:hypothetical protein
MENLVVSIPDGGKAGPSPVVSILAAGISFKKTRAGTGRSRDPARQHRFVTNPRILEKGY